MPRLQNALLCTVGVFLLWGGMYASAAAATLSLSPETGVHQAGSTFTARVVVNTAGQAINAAEGTLSFRPNQLQVVSVSNANSIFGLWTEDPSYSNSAGTVRFSGGTPQGFTGGSGSVVSITFRAASAGTHRVSFTEGAVLAADGQGTNILNTMNGGSYTISSASTAPEPEEIEYVASPETPAAPTITSDTHPADSFSTASTAVLKWRVPSEVTAVRTVLDENPSAIPVNVYDTPISDITLSDLADGVQYFHLQFKNAEGWGQVAHYRLAVDSAPPSEFTIDSAPDNDPASPTQKLVLNAVDKTSGISRYLVKVDDAQPYEYVPETGSSTVTLPELEPGYHTIIIEAFDAAGNSRIATHSLTIEAFAKPRFTEYPQELNAQVIPVIKGVTRADSEVTVTISRRGAGDTATPQAYTVRSDDSGTFTVVPDGPFATGVYELTAVATDQYGAKSERSDPVSIAVQPAGYVQIGTLLVNALSVIVPLIGLVLLLILGFWYALYRIVRLRTHVRRESREAYDVLRDEFAALEQTVSAEAETLRESRKSEQLTKAETALIDALRAQISESKTRAEKEVADIKNLVSQTDKPKSHHENS